MSAVDSRRSAFPAPGLLGKLDGRGPAGVPGRCVHSRPGELIFGLGACRVPGCPRQPRTRQLCRGHYYRWQRRGGPDIEVFIADPGPGPVGRTELTACAVAGCRYGAARQGLCVSHQRLLGAGGQARRRRSGWRVSPAGRRQRSAGSAACRSAPCGPRGSRRSATTTSPAGRPSAAPRSRSSYAAARPPGTTASTSGRWTTSGSSSWSCSTRCSAATTSGRSTPTARPSRPVIRLAAASEQDPCWSGRWSSGVSTSPRCAGPAMTRTGSLRSCATPHAASGGSRLRQRLGERVPPRRVGAASARDRGHPGPVAVRPHRPAMAAGAGQAIRALAAQYRPQHQPGRR